MKKEKNNFGEKLRDLRKQKGMTQIELAEALDCSQAIITAYENNIRKPPLNKIAVIAELFNVSINDLYGTKPLKQNNKIKNPKLWKKFEQLEKLSDTEKRTVIKMIDTLAKSHG